MDKTHKFCSLPIQSIETNGGVLLKRGTVQLKIQGKSAAKAIRHLLSVIPQNGVTLERLLDHFNTLDQPNIERLVHLLWNKRFFVSVETNDDPKVEVQETPLDIFYWHFGETTPNVNRRLNERLLVIMGVNTISRQLIRNLDSSGIRNIQLVDHPQLRNSSLCDNHGALNEKGWGNNHSSPMNLDDWQLTVDPHSSMTIVATSDLGFPPVYQEWNRFCVDQNQHFFPIWLENMIGYLGPLVIPGESPCLACARGRMNSHIEDHETQNFLDHNAIPGEHPVGFHPAMAFVLGDLAAFELMKFYSQLFARSSLGRLMEVSLLAPRMKSRKIFKLPRCQICSPLLTTPSMISQLDVCMEPK